MYICDICGYESMNKQSYCAHRRIHKNNYIPINKICENNYNNEYICKGCNRIFNSINSLHGHYNSCYKFNLIKWGLNEIIRDKPYLFKFYEPELDEYKLNYLMEFIDINFPTINGLKEFLHIGIHKSYLLHFLFSVDKIRYYFIDLYNRYTIPDISKLLDIPDSVLCRLFREYNIDKKWFRSSKIHLRYRHLLRNLLGHDTITEYRVGSNWIDEYCPDLNLAIEFDGEPWHQNKNADKIRESEITKLIGCDFIRIPIHSYIGIDEIEFKNIINSYLKSIKG